jgi:hypothetical protein
MLENLQGDVSVEFAPTHHGGMSKDLKRREGGDCGGLRCVLGDGHGRKGEEARECNRMSHARRYVVKAEISDPELSAEGLQLFQALYALEAEAAVRGLDSTQRQELEKRKQFPC